MFFLGEYHHSLDAKGRIILPSRYREQLAMAFITSEVDGCLALWTPDEFERRALEIKERARGGPDERNMARAFYAGAQEVNPDSQGRMAIPPHLRAFAGLERNVVLTGHYDHMEIWDSETWPGKKQSGEANLAAGATAG